MPRFFFDVYDGHSSRDNEGTVLPNVDEARREAVRLAGAILRDEAGDLTHTDWRMEITDEQRTICFVLSFSVFRRIASLPVADAKAFRL